jgi:hypothetical protein
MKVRATALLSNGLSALYKQAFTGSDASSTLSSHPAKLGSLNIWGKNEKKQSLSKSFYENCIFENRFQLDFP